MDILKDKDKIKKSIKKYSYTLGRITHFKICDFRHPIRTKKHEKTIYYLFDCLIISRDNKPIPYGNHIIQLPSKRVVLPLIEILEKKGKIDQKDLNLTIEKEDNYHFRFVFH